MTDIAPGRTDFDEPEPREEIDTAELEAMLPITNGHLTASTDPDWSIPDETGAA